MPGPHAETSACASDCLAVHMQHGEAKGSMFDTTLPLSGTISTYVACPPGETVDSMKEKKATKVLVNCADVYGPHYINNQLLMDWHASNGTHTQSRNYENKNPNSPAPAQATSSSPRTTSTANSSTTSAPTPDSPFPSGSASSRGPSGTTRGTRLTGRACC